MPEGDTIFRTAASVRMWLHGRQVTAVESPSPRIAASEQQRMELLIGRVVGAVEARGKNLLMRFDLSPVDVASLDIASRDVASRDVEADRVDQESLSESLVLHTHMKMTGSWHVYAHDARWQRPRHQARLVIHCDERLAVCFNVPVLSLEPYEDPDRRRTLHALGPDVLNEPLDLDTIVARVSTDDDRPIGEVLLDQRVVCGIGNIYRCESLFLEGLHPWTRISKVDRQTFQKVIATAARLMRANLGESVGRDFGLGANVNYVYGRAGLPCRRCRTIIETKRLGTQARIVFWCPTCQMQT
jgi:endonuclease VIII